MFIAPSLYSSHIIERLRFFKHSTGAFLPGYLRSDSDCVPQSTADTGGLKGHYTLQIAQAVELYFTFVASYGIQIVINLIRHIIVLPE